MDKRVVLKVVLSIVGTALFQFSGTYNLNPTAPTLAYLAAISGAVGSYLLGLFQDRPSK